MSNEELAGKSVASLEASLTKSARHESLMLSAKLARQAYEPAASLIGKAKHWVEENPGTSDILAAAGVVLVGLALRGRFARLGSVSQIIGKNTPGAAVLAEDSMMAARAISSEARAVQSATLAGSRTPMSDLGATIERLSPVRNLAQTTSLKDIARLPSAQFKQQYLDNRVDERIWLWRIGDETPDLVRPYYEPQLAQLFQQVKPSLLHVLTDTGAKGTAFFVDPRGYALTAGHVVTDAQRVLVWNHVGQKGFAKVIDVNLWEDLALLKLLKMHPRGYLAFGEAAKAGQEVVAIGFPRWYSRGLLSPGIVQEPARAAEALKHLYRDKDWLPFHMRDKDIITMNLMPGSSGGPIVDATTGSLTSVALGDFKGTNFARGPSLQYVQEFCARNGITKSSVCSPHPRYKAIDSRDSFQI